MLPMHGHEGGSLSRLPWSKAIQNLRTLRQYGIGALPSVQLHRNRTASIQAAIALRQTPAIDVKEKGPAARGALGLGKAHSAAPACRPPSIGL